MWEGGGGLLGYYVRFSMKNFKLNNLETRTVKIWSIAITNHKEREQSLWPHLDNSVSLF